MARCRLLPLPLNGYMDGSPKYMYPYSVHTNHVTNDKNFDFSEFKAFADDNSNVTQMMQFNSDMVENIVRKGENAGSQHFLLFPQCFQKAFVFYSGS